MGCIGFTSLFLKSERSPKDSPILGWVTGRSMFISSDGQYESDDVQHKILKHISVSSSINGSGVLCMLNRESINDQDTRKYMDSNANYIAQHSYLSYIFTLHQVYYFQLFSAKIKMLQTSECSMCKTHGIEEIYNQYLIFKSRYCFKTVSMRSIYQTIYKKDLEWLELEESFEFLDNSIDIIYKKINTQSEKTTNRVLAIISAMSVVPVIISIGDLIKSGGNEHYVITIIAIAIGVLMALTILSLTMDKIGASFCKRIKGKKIKRK